MRTRINAVNKRFGFFDDEAKAARAYDDAARTHVGEFARLNFDSNGDDNGR